LAHREACGAAAARRERWARDRSVECGICLERVLDKPDPSARRFGLMACEHSFCLSCIRAWRSTDEADVDTALRTCPVCRTTTHFITPSATWPASAEEKDAVLRAYKAKMAAIDCM
jgi:E3 ubiquitin-protein ligase makorin